MSLGQIHSTLETHFLTCLRNVVSVGSHTKFMELTHQVPGEIAIRSARRLFPMTSDF